MKLINHAEHVRIRAERSGDRPADLTADVFTHRSLSATSDVDGFIINHANVEGNTGESRHISAVINTNVFKLQATEDNVTVFPVRRSVFRN